MAMGMITLVRVLQQNGHLVIEGNESLNELREAVIHLHGHTDNECQRPHWGMPMAAIIPDITVITAPSNRGRPRKPVNIDLTSEAL